MDRILFLLAFLFFFMSLSLPAALSLPVSFFLISSTGQLSLDEFIDGARKDKWVMKMLQMDVNPGEWISEQRRKSALF